MWTVGAPVGLLVASHLAQSRASDAWIAAGLTLAVFGQAVRMWAAGHIRKNRALATDGPYCFTRNPLYLGSFLIGSGYSFLSGWWPSFVIIVLGFFLIYVPTIRHEEGQLRALFESDYAEYCRRVPMFFPRLKLLPASGDFSWRQLADNREWGTFVANLIGVVMFLCLH